MGSPGPRGSPSCPPDGRTYCGELDCGVVVLGVVESGVDGVLGLGFTSPEGLAVLGAGVESLGAAELGGVELGGVELVVAAALAVPPVGAPDHQSCDARWLGDAFR